MACPFRQAPEKPRYLGTLTSDLAQDAEIPVNLKGVYVNTITQNGPADKAGIHGSTTDQYLKKHLGDVIIAVMDITSPNQMIFSTISINTRLPGTILL